MSAERVMPPPLERMRMALADTPSLGFSPSVVLPVRPEDPPHASHRLAVAVPLDVRWRLREAALVDTPRCRCCHDFVTRTWMVTRILPESPCIATRRFVEDCGVSR